MTRECNDVIGLAKATLWEEAKGKLRAMVAAEGSSVGRGLTDDGRFHFQVIEEEVDAFIAVIEDNELNL